MHRIKLKLLELIYAYVILYFGVLAEGELAIIGGTIAAQQNILNINLVAITAFFSTLTIDWGLFFSGKFFGKRIFSSFPKLQEKTQKPRTLVSENPNLILVFYRYLYGLRIITLLILGMSNVPAKKFIPYSLIAILIWTILFSALGYFMGEIISKFISENEHIGYVILLSIVSALAILFLLKRLIRKAI